MWVRNLLKKVTHERKIFLLFLIGTLVFLFEKSIVKEAFDTTVVAATALFF